MRFSAPELEEFTRHLAWIRASMQPAMEPVDLTPATPIAPNAAIRWQVTEDALPGQFRLHLLHPGFGWMWIPLHREAFDAIS